MNNVLKKYKYFYYFISNLISTEASVYKSWRGEDNLDEVTNGVDKHRRRRVKRYNHPSRIRVSIPIQSIIYIPVGSKTVEKNQKEAMKPCFQRIHFSSSPRGACVCGSVGS